MFDRLGKISESLHKEGGIHLLPPPSTSSVLDGQPVNLVMLMFLIISVLVRGTVEGDGGFCAVVEVVE